MSTIRERSVAHRWALVRGAGAALQRFRSSSSGVPRIAWIRWASSLSIGALGCVILMLVLTQLTRAVHNGGLQAWDEVQLLRVEQLPFAFDAAVWWEAFGASSMLIPLVAVAIVVSIWHERPILAAEFLASFLLAKPIFLTGWMTWDRARPDLIAKGVAAPSLHSFPSGHAVQTAAIYGLLTYLWLRHSRSTTERMLGGLAWISLVTIVGLARIRIGAHWPSDVLAGMVVGVAWLAALVYALRSAERVGGR